MPDQDSHQFRSATNWSGLQPSNFFRHPSWGVAPGWYMAAPLALRKTAFPFIAHHLVSPSLHITLTEAPTLRAVGAPEAVFPLPLFPGLGYTRRVPVNHSTD